MKKIHKKIGAMALAGMVVAGGVAASGGSSHAVYFSKGHEGAIYSKGSLDQLNEYDRKDYYFLKEEFDKVGIKVIALSNNRSVMDQYIKDNFKYRSSLRNRLLEVPWRFVLRKDIMQYLIGRQSSGKKFDRVQFDNLDLLIALK